MRRATRPIYGISKKKVAGGDPGNSGCLPACPDICGTYIAVERLIYNFQLAIKEFFPSFTAVSTFIANMSGRASVPPTIFVRLAWRTVHDGVAFDIKNAIHRLQIKAIYIQYGWSDLVPRDPLFKDALGLTLL